MIFSYDYFINSASCIFRRLFFLPPMLFTLNYPYYSPVNTSSLLTLQKLKKETKKKLTKVAVFLLDLDRIVLEALDELEGCLCLLS